MMAKTKTEYTDKIAKRLEIGDVVVSSTGKKLTVTKTIQKENKTIILFDDDMEIDFDPYFRFEKVVVK
jgi:hypothetical protein